MDNKMIVYEEKLRSHGIVPVIKIEDISVSCKLAETLTNAGLPIAEITFRADGAEKVIKQIKQEYPDMLVLAGTVLYIEQIKHAISAGADIIVTPGFNERIVEYCVKNSIPIIPGCVTPLEIETAMMYGIKVLKYFPADAMCGTDAIKSLKGTYDSISFMPTCGINLLNLADYLSLSNVLACGGSFLVSDQRLKDCDWVSIYEDCIKIKEIVNSVRRKG